MKSGCERFLSIILYTIFIWIDCLHFDNDNNNNNKNKTNNCEDKIELVGFWSPYIFLD